LSFAVWHQGLNGNQQIMQWKSKSFKRWISACGKSKIILDNGLGFKATRAVVKDHFGKAFWNLF